MMSATVRDYLGTVPFAPFVIQINDGRRFTVPHPDFAFVCPKGSAVTLYSDEDGAMQLSSILMASVEPLPGRSTRRQETIEK